MKYKLLSLLLAAALAISMGACAKTDSKAESAASQTPGAFGAENLDGTAQPMAETTGQPEGNPPAGSLLESNALENSGDLTERAIECAVAAVYDDLLTYDPGDPVYFWRALGYLLARNPEYPLADGTVKIPVDAIDPYVTALFGTYEGQYPSLGEENPLVAEENGMYSVVSPGPFNHTFTMTEPEAQGDGTYICRVEMRGLAGAGETAGYTVTLRDYPAENAMFSYCVTAISEG